MSTNKGDENTMRLIRICSYLQAMLLLESAGNKVHHQRAECDDREASDRAEPFRPFALAIERAERGDRVGQRTVDVRRDHMHKTRVDPLAPSALLDVGDRSSSGECKKNYYVY